jgi:hypothetical protein
MAPATEPLPFSKLSVPQVQLNARMLNHDAQILDALNDNVGKRARITFDDGVVQSVLIDCVDEEGFLHSGRTASIPRLSGLDLKT